jgi:hypothetical protein
LKVALRQLLDDLDVVGDDHDEIGDTDVREAMWEAVANLFIRPQPGYQIPQDFKMFSDEGNAAVVSALSRFFSHPDLIESAAKLATPQERLDAFQDEDLASARTSYFDSYFGWSEHA